MTPTPRTTPSLPDYHVHTERCGHATGAAADYVAAAIERGLPAVGIADHLPLLHTSEPDPTLAMSLDDLPLYVEELQALKERHPEYVLMGIEADYRPDTVDETRALLAEFPFDYVIGSVHYLDGWGFDDPRYVDGFASQGIDDVYRDYMQAIGEAAESGLFDIIGHLDLVKKFGHRPDGDLSGDWSRLTQRFKHAGVAVEVNTSGIRKPIAEMYPAPSVLALLAEHRVPLTFGSDAHRPEDVGRDLPAAAALALEAGHRTYLSLSPVSAGDETMASDDVAHRTRSRRPRARRAVRSLTEVGNGVQR